MIKSIKFVSVYVSDQDAALAFYTQKLGFTVVTTSRWGRVPAGSSSRSPARRRGW